MAKYETKKYKLIINYNADNVENVVYTGFARFDGLHDIIIKKQQTTEQFCVI